MFRSIVGKLTLASLSLSKPPSSALRPPPLDLWI